MARIVIVNRFYEPDISATSQLLTDLARDLVGNNHQVCIITSRQLYGDSNAKLPPEQTIAGVEIHRVWSSSYGRAGLIGRAADYLTFYITATIQLFRLLRNCDCVIAMTDPPALSILCWLVASYRRVPIINWLQDLFPEIAVALDVKGANLLSRLLMPIRNHSLRASSMNVVLGDVMSDHVKALGVSPDRIRIIPNWSDDHSVIPIESCNNPLVQEWGLGNKLVIGYSGNMGRAHEFDTLIDAAKLLKNDDRIIFLFIGGGAQRQHIMSELKRHDIRNVLFKDYQPRARLAQSLSTPDLHIISLLPNLEALIVPSKFYGVAAAGRPTIFIGSPEGEIARLIQYNDCGYVVEVGDSAKLVKIINSVLDNEESILIKGKNARILFEQRFTKTLSLSKWSNLIEEICGRPHEY